MARYINNTEISAELSRDVRGNYLYIIEESEDGPFKVGITSTPSARLQMLQTGNPRTLAFTVMWDFASRAEAAEAEKAVLAKYRHRAARGEWIDVDVGELIFGAAFEVIR